MGDGLWLMLIFIVLAAVVFVIMSRRDRKKAGSAFDERQKLARGKAYRLGFFSLAAYMFIYAVIDDFGIRWCDTDVGMLAGLLLVMTIVILTFIHYDAYIGLRENAKTTVLLYIVMGALNLGSAVLSTIRGMLIGENGLTVYFLYYMSAGMILTIAAALLIQRARNKREEDSDE